MATRRNVAGIAVPPPLHRFGAPANSTTYCASSRSRLFAVTGANTSLVDREQRRQRAIPTSGPHMGFPALVPDHPGRTTSSPPPARDPVNPAATARTDRSPVPFRRVPAARALHYPAATAQRSQLRPTPSLRSVALVNVVEPFRSRRCPAPRRIAPRRGQPERPQHPRDRRRILDRRQHAPRARALRADQHVDAEHAPQQIRPRQALPATAALATAVWRPQACTGAAFRLLAKYRRGRRSCQPARTGAPSRPRSSSPPPSRRRDSVASARNRSGRPAVRPAASRSPPNRRAHGVAAQRLPALAVARHQRSTSSRWIVLPSSS